MSTWAAVRLVARLELCLALRSRWTQIFAAVFAALALAVAGAGYILSGGHGVQDFARTGASLVQVILLLVPLTALLIGVQAFASERGAAELLLSQPVSRPAVLCGKLFGLFQALVAAESLGLGAAGLVIFSRSGEEGLAGFVLVFLAAVVLTMVFLALAAALASASFGRGRARALALALVVWFVAVVLFDVAVLAAASWLRSGSASRLLITAVLVNPVDGVRTGALLGIEGAAAFGGASLAFLRFTGGPLRAGLLLGVSLAAWVALPIVLAVRRLQRADV
jgi:Cu-processing system permease protein